MKRLFATIAFSSLSLATLCDLHAEVPAPTPFGAVPSRQQLAWHEIEIFGMVNFSTITFYRKEWGYGDEEAAKFNPSAFDALQIVRAAKAGGLKGLVIDAKHHGGFCLWPSAYNDTYTVKNAPWREGKGDMVKEFADACRAEGLLVGVYLSPWDRNHKAYGRPEYVTYYHQQLRELLTNYGPLFEIWFDGANGGDGWYGGTCEKRKIGPDYYQWEKVMALVQECQPEAVCFGRRDIRWVGNEIGVAPDPCWASVTRNGKSWYPAECDFPLRHGWFWHPGGQGRHSAGKLVDRYFTSVGRNGAMDLGIAPDERGRIDEYDAEVLKGFGERIHAIFATNLARTASASASNVRGNAAAYSANNVLNGMSKFKTYWATDDHVKDADIVVDFGTPTPFSVVSLREPIQLGQRIDAWSLEAWENGSWKAFATGMGIGARRLWRGEPVVADKIRLCVKNASACPALSEFAVFLEPEASRRESGARMERVAETGVEKSLWRVRSATAEGSPAKQAIDGNSQTFWHTHTRVGRQAPPQAIVVDMGKELELTGFLYLPRQDRCTVGNVTRYTFEASLDEKSWHEISKGEFGNIEANPVLQKVQFAQTIKARYFRFTATAALDGCVNVAELGVVSQSQQPE
jgi:alpha-L-fucosidase